MKIPGTDMHVYSPWNSRNRAERQGDAPQGGRDGDQSTGLSGAPEVPGRGARAPRRWGFWVGPKLPTASPGAEAPSLAGPGVAAGPVMCSVGTQTDLTGPVRACGVAASHPAALGTLKTDLPASLAGNGAVLGYLGQTVNGSLRHAQLVTRHDSGYVRRHPLPHGPDLAVELPISRGVFFDGPDGAVTRRGGFSVDPDSQAVYFEVDGRPVAPEHTSRPVYDDRMYNVSGLDALIAAAQRGERPPSPPPASLKAFPLGDNRWMVPQVATQDAGAACEAAICMSWGLDFERATQGLDMSFRTWEQIADSLAARTGRKPVVEPGDVSTPENEMAFARTLSRQLERCGPAILKRGSHTCVLHALTLDSSGSGGKALIGDPYHGTYGEVAFGPGHRDFWSVKSPLDAETPTTAAMFIPPGSAPGAAGGSRAVA